MPHNGMIGPPPKQRLRLPGVTLCAVTSTNVEATVQAMRTCIARVAFAEAILFTHVPPHDIVNNHEVSAIRLVEIEQLTSAEAYSRFILERLVDYVATDHCLLAQWDGHVIDPARWRPEFLTVDYIGASWPQFGDGHDVGNGGFSLRSRRLMKLCRQPQFQPVHPEDVAIGRTNRAFLESQGMRFATAALADAFSSERAGDPAQSFGYHGVFLMPRVLGPDRFWEIYRKLDDRASVWRDLGVIMKTLRPGGKSALRSLELFFSRFSDYVGKRF